MEELIKRTIQKYSLFSTNETILVGVSGGIDSVVLLEVLVKLRAEYGVNLLIGHINHCLRGDDSDRDEAFVQSLGATYGITVLTRQVDVRAYAAEHGNSIEEAARHCRYTCLTQWAEEHHAGAICLAHHKNDQAETVLMRVLKGTGMRGLQAIRPIGQYNNVRLVRPLISVSRADIEGYAKERHLEYCIDASNDDVTFVRNCIRNEVLPYLKEKINPQVIDALNGLAENAQIDYALVERDGEEVYREAKIEASEYFISFSKSELLNAQPAEAYYAIEKAIRVLGGEGLSSVCWDIIISFWHEKGACDVGGGLSVRAEQGCIIVSKTVSSPDLAYTLAVDEEIHIPAAGGTVRCEAVATAGDLMRYADDRYTEIISADGLTFPLTLRRWRPGDCIVPLGMEGTKKISDILTDKKVGRHKKSHTYVVFSGDMIVWCMPYTIDERVKVDKASRSCIKLSFKHTAI